MNDAAKRVQAYTDIQNLHNKYGDIVRVGMSSSMHLPILSQERHEYYNIQMPNF